MKPLTGGTIMMVLLLLAGLGARGVMERWRKEQEARERQRLQIEHNLSVAEKKRVRQEADMSKPPYDLWKAVHALYTKAESGDPYAQAAYAMVLRDSQQRYDSLTPEYEPIGRLLIGPDYERVVKEVRFIGRESHRAFSTDYPKWFRRAALQGNAYGMYGMYQVSLSHPPTSLRSDYAEALKWARLTVLHAEATEAGLPSRFAALGRVTRPLADDLPDFLSQKQLSEVERVVRAFTPVKE
ncbi:MAG: hypothetical protein ACO3ND_01150 [Opitutales bacterium]